MHDEPLSIDDKRVFVDNCLQDQTKTLDKLVEQSSEFAFKKLHSSAEGRMLTRIAIDKSNKLSINRDK